jgi:hypothetical protein
MKINQKMEREKINPIEPSLTHLESLPAPWQPKRSREIDGFSDVESRVKARVVSSRKGDYISPRTMKSTHYADSTSTFLL